MTRAPLLLFLFAATASCAEGQTFNAVHRDAAGEADAPGAAQEAAREAGRDAGVDVGPDTPVDAGVDAARDASPADARDAATSDVLDATADARDASATDAQGIADARDAAGGVDASVNWGTTSATAYSGNAMGGTEYVADCPTSMALVGAFGESDQMGGGGALRRLGAVCATVSVSRAAGGASIVLSGATDQMAYGGTGRSSVRAVCGANQVVVGFGGRAGLYVDQLVLRCAPLSVAGSAPSGTAMVPGTATAITAIGGTGGNPIMDVNCGSGTFARGAVLRAGDWVDAFAIRCAAGSVP